MSWFRKIDLIDPYMCSPLAIVEPSALLLEFPSFTDNEDGVQELCFPFAFPSSAPVDLFETVTDLVKIEKSPFKYQLIRRRLEPDYPLKYLCERVSDLESKFDRLVTPKNRACDRKYKLTKEIKCSGERRKYRWEAEIQGPPGRKYKVEAETDGPTESKYKWEAEFEGPEERKYKWTTEIKRGKKDEERQLVFLKKAKAIAAAEAEKKKNAKKKKKKKKSYNWTTEVKSERENGEVSHTYIIKASTGGDKGKHEDKEKKEKKSKKKEKSRVVVIEEEEEDNEMNPNNIELLFLRR